MQVRWESDVEIISRLLSQKMDIRTSEKTLLETARALFQGSGSLERAAITSRGVSLGFNLTDNETQAITFQLLACSQTYAVGNRKQCSQFIDSKSLDIGDHPHEQTIISFVVSRHSGRLSKYFGIEMQNRQNIVLLPGWTWISTSLKRSYRMSEDDLRKHERSPTQISLSELLHGGCMARWTSW